MTKYVNEMEDYLYNHNYISENNNNIKQQELSQERASCIVQKYRTLTEEKDKEIERLNNIINELEKYLEEEKDEKYSWHYRKWIRQVQEKLKELKNK